MTLHDQTKKTELGHNSTVHRSRIVTRDDKGGTVSRSPNHYGGAEWREPKSPNDVTSTFFSTVHLLPKYLVEDGGTKLASFPGRHLISLRL